ncbi:MAG: arginine--tRNA ligase [Rhodocyclaceae bacterium]|nr:arginine--tRNA ligase [Rhodocyclaceae bacterium]
MDTPMAADIRSELTALLRAALASVAPDSGDTPILLERPKQAAHGDFASNLALQLAKPLKLNPRDIAGRLLAELPKSPLVAKAEVAGAGFINFTLAPAAKLQVVRAVLARGADFGRSELGGGAKVQVEFVSANPTGPLHVGHGRGAAYGASLANLLDFAGFKVVREFYVNDAGRQMDILALSTWLRYLELFGATIPFPRTPTRAATCATWAAPSTRRMARATAVIPNTCWTARPMRRRTPRRTSTPSSPTPSACSATTTPMCIITP